MDVRPLRPDEGLIYRNLRLRALSDAPDAFGQTLGEAESRSDEEWIQRAGEIAACPEREVLFYSSRRQDPMRHCISALGIRRHRALRHVGRSGFQEAPRGVSSPRGRDFLSEGST